MTIIDLIGLIIGFLIVIFTVEFSNRIYWKNKDRRFESKWNHYRAQKRIMGKLFKDGIELCLPSGLYFIKGNPIETKDSLTHVTGVEFEITDISCNNYAPPDPDYENLLADLELKKAEEDKENLK